MKIRIGLLCLILMLLSSLACSPSGEQALNSRTNNLPEERIEETGEQVKVTTKEIKENRRELEIDLKIPVLSGLKDQALQSRLNNYLEQRILDSKNAVEELAVQAREAAEVNNLEFYPYSVYSTFEVPYNQKGILSINLINYSFTGGAHGITAMNTLNIDLTTGKTLQLKDFFKPDEDYKQLILQQIHEQIEANKENFYENITEELQTISDDQSFYLEDNYLVIYFGQYEIAPYSSGIVKFKIPLSPE